MTCISIARRLLAGTAIGLLVGTPISGAQASSAPSVVPPASVTPPPAATASESAPRWDYLPVVGYRGDGLYFSLRVGPSAPAWQVEATRGHVRVQVGADRKTVDAHLPLQGSIPTTLFFRGPDGARGVRLVEPGKGEHLTCDATGRLQLEGDPAVLVEERIEADHSRLWASLRRQSATPDFHCAVTIVPPEVRPGDSALLATIAACQGHRVRGESVLVLVPGADRLVGWKQREFRQALAWLVADLMARHARHVVLVDPIAPALEESLVKPLREQVEDVARAYHCRHVVVPDLGDARYWEVAPGVLGPELNASGRAALAHALAPWQ